MARPGEWRYILPHPWEGLPKDGQTMATKSWALSLLAAALLFVLALVGLDVVDSARAVVVLAGYLWFALFAAAGLFLVLRTLGSRRAH